MAETVLIVMTLAFVALSIVVVTYVLGIRSKSSRVRNAARHFHHTVGNRLQMRSAGTPRSFASVIRHRGRRTGRPYETPVWAMPTEDGFVIAIVYGSHTDWLRNVLANKVAQIVYQGVTYRVNKPEIVPMETTRVYFPTTTRRSQRLVGVDQCLRVRLVKFSKRSAA